MSFSFGTPAAPASAPANPGLSGGFSFGANKPATPGFGLGATSQPSTGLFGTPATSAPAFGSTGFGATSTSAFGSGTTPAFGATSAAPAFGASTTPAFGTTSTAPAFGATGTPAFGATSTAPAFGTGTTPAFGTTNPTPAFGTTGLGGTGGLNFGGATSTATTGLTLGTPATTTSTGLGGLGNFSFNTTTQSTGLGLFNTTTTSAGAGLFGPKLTTSLTGSQPSSTATPSLGLGGVAPTGAANTTTTDGKTEPPKQTKLPNEISSTVETFKEFVKRQKSLSSEVMRVSIKPLHKVSVEAEQTLRLALSLSGEVGKARAHARRMRTQAATALANAEAVANAPVSELEGTAPPAYVKDLVTELEQQLITFRRQMDVADKQMQASPKLLTEQELTLGIRRMHESLVALAGRLQAVHTQVEAQKEQYLNLRKYVLKDPTNVFDTPTPSSSLDQILRDAEGSRKKLKSSHLTTPLGAAVITDPRAALGNIHQLAGPTPFTYIGSTFPNTDTSAATWQPTPQPTANLSTNMGTNISTNLGTNFGTSLGTNFGTSFGTSFGASQPENTGFQLQKPPGKRGKQ